MHFPPCLARYPKWVCCLENDFGWKNTVRDPRYASAVAVGDRLNVNSTPICLQMLFTIISTRKVCQHAIRHSVLVHVLFSRIKKQGSDTSLKKALVPRDMWRDEALTLR